MNISDQQQLFGTPEVQPGPVAVDNGAKIYSFPPHEPQERRVSEAAQDQGWGLPPVDPSDAVADGPSVYDPVELEESRGRHPSSNEEAVVNMGALAVAKEYTKRKMGGTLPLDASDEENLDWMAKRAEREAETPTASLTNKQQLANARRARARAKQLRKKW